MTDLTLQALLALVGALGLALSALLAVLAVRVYARDDIRAVKRDLADRQSGTGEGVWPSGKAPLAPARPGHDPSLDIRPPSRTPQACDPMFCVRRRVVSVFCEEVIREA